MLISSYEASTTKRLCKELMGYLGWYCRKISLETVNGGRETTPQARFMHAMVRAVRMYFQPVNGMFE